MNIYMVGIKGSGMASLAQILFDLGHGVKGADTNNYVFTEENLKEKALENNLIGPCIVCNAGPQVVGICFLGEKREEEIIC